jgi:hypothetical protein
LIFVGLLTATLADARVAELTLLSDADDESPHPLSMAVPRASSAVTIDDARVSDRKARIMMHFRERDDLTGTLDQGESGRLTLDRHDFDWFWQTQLGANAGQPNHPLVGLINKYERSIALQVPEHFFLHT